MRGLDERRGRAILKERFEAAGLSIAEDVWLEVGGARVELDGWDAARKIGYEFVTDEAGDRAQFDAPAIETLEAAMHCGELFVLLVDERDARVAEDAEDDEDAAAAEAMLARAAVRFLAALRARGALA